MPDPLDDLAARLDADVRTGRITIDAAERELGRRAFELLRRDGRLEHPQSTPGGPGRGDPRLAAVLRHLSDLEDEDGWKPAPEYRSVALALIDAIWSMGVRYGGVLNVIARYTAARVEQGADAKLDAPEDLLTFIEGCGSADAFAEAVKNRQRTSSRSGILKAEAVQWAAAVLASHGVSTPEHLRGVDAPALATIEADWRAIQGQGSGLSWEYFLMLCGISGVKADRHIRRFVAEALEVPESQVSAADARALVIAAISASSGASRITRSGTRCRVADPDPWINAAAPATAGGNDRRHADRSALGLRSLFATVPARTCLGRRLAPTS